jgi:ABC-2 type transport system ATP-binding protein
METDSLVIEAREVTKIIKGRRILDGVSLLVAPSQVVGFIGPNGAGKTTLIRILSGMSRATSGDIRVCGRPPGSASADSVDLGLLPEAPGFIEHLSGRKNLTLLASIRGRVGRSEIDEAIRSCGLDPADRSPVSKYSLGMRQRLALAQALMEHPRVLLLDEPTNGLDVLGITELRRIIRTEAASGVGVLLASHLLTEVELACDRVLMVQGGRVLQELATTELQHAVGRVRVTVSTEGDWKRLSEAFDAQRLSQDGRISGFLSTDLEVPALVRVLVGMGVDIEAIGPGGASLEEAFLARIEAES